MDDHVRQKDINDMILSGMDGQRLQNVYILTPSRIISKSRTSKMEKNMEN